MKSKTLNENKDFRRLYYRGKSQASPCLVTYVSKSRGNETRIGITSGKKIGNAVKRNRARRVIRAAYSVLEPRIDGCYDIVFVARTRTTVVKSQAVEKAMLEHMQALGAIDE